MLDVSGGQSNDILSALQAQLAAWEQLISAHKLDRLKMLAKPTTLSWKVADKAALYKNLADNAGNIEQVHIGTVDGRYIASAVLVEPFEGLHIFKILERRPGSQDPLGLDSIDYIVEDTEQVFSLLHAAGTHVEEQQNAVHDWISLRFGTNDQFEAKFKDHLVIDAGIQELKEASQATRAAIDKKL